MARHVVIIWILIIFVLITITSAPFIPDKNPFLSDCYVVINEIKTASQVSTTEPYEFLELSQVCGVKPKSWRPPSIGTFALITIRVKTNSIVSECILSGYMRRSGDKKDTPPLYVIGTSTTPQKIASSETNCAFAADFPDMSDPSESLLYVLLHSKTPNFFNELRLKRLPGVSVLSKLVDGYARRRILQTTHDMVWLGVQRPAAVPEDLKKLQSEFRDENLNEKFIQVSHEQLQRGTSFIRCSTSKYGFEPTSFRISSHSTPMEENACENSIALITTTVRNNEANQDNPSAPVTPQERRPVSPIIPLPTPPLRSANDVAYDESIIDIQNHHSHSLDVDRVKSPEVKSWFQWLKGSHPSESAFRCRKCSHVISTGLVVEREHGSNRDRLMRAGGSPVNSPPGSSSKSVKRRNNDLIESHSKNKIQEIAEFYFSILEQSQDAGFIKQKLLEKTSPFRKYYKPTEDVHRTVITAVQVRIPFMQFKALSKLLKHLEVDLGEHFQNESGMKSIIMSLGTIIHQQLLQYLRQHPNLILSVIADASTDLTVEDHLSIRLQFADENLQVFNVQYGFIKLGDDHRGVTLFELLRNRFEEDGMVDYMRDRMGATATDGAGNMILTFADAIKDFSTRKVLANHCLAHRLELALNHAFKKTEYFQHIDSIINRLHRFYHTSSLCGAHLEALRVDEGEAKFHLQRIFPVRWISSRNRVCRTILRYFGTIARDLQNIVSEEKMDRKRWEEADEIHRELTDRTFVSTLIFIADVSEVFSKVSEDLQHACRSIIGTRNRRTKLTQELWKIRKWREGQMSFQASIHMECDNLDCRNWKHIETAASVKLRDIPLLDSTMRKKPETPRLSASIGQYIRNILNEFPTIFPERIHSDFDMFEPSLLEKFLAPRDPSQAGGAEDEEEIGTEAHEFDNSDSDTFDEDIEQWTDEDGNWSLEDRWLCLNRYFNLITPPNRQTSSQLADQYRQLVASVKKHDLFPSVKSLRPEDFWMKFANTAGIKWTTPLKLAVRIFLGIPASSASCESSFSIYNKYKTKFRSSLNVDTVEAMMPIRDNVSPDAEDEEIVFYAREWTKSHFRSDERKKPEAKPIEPKTGYRFPFAPSFFDSTMLPTTPATMSTRRQ